MARICVIDDKEMMRESVAAALIREDHHVEIVGLEAEVSCTLGHVQRPIGIRRSCHHDAKQAPKRFSYH